MKKLIGSAAIVLLLCAFGQRALAAPGLHTMPRALNFGNLQLASNPSPETRQFTIVNRSTTETINAIVTGAAGAFQSQAVTLSLPPHQSVIIQVNFNPPVQAKYTGIITVTPSLGRAFNVVLRGRAKGNRPVTLPDPAATPTPTARPTSTPTPALSTPTPTAAPATPTPTPLVSTPTPTAASATPTPAPTPSPTATPTPQANTNAAIMFTFVDQFNSGNEQQVVNLTVEDPNAPDKQIIGVSAPLVSNYNGDSVDQYAFACFVVPITAPIHNVVKLSGVWCAGGAVDFTGCGVGAPAQARTATSPANASQLTFVNSSSPELQAEAYTVGLAATPQDLEVPGLYDPAANLIDNGSDETYGLAMALGAVPPNPPLVIQPSPYIVSGCGGNCPTTPTFYNSFLAQLGDPQPNVACTITAPLE
ncbi:MAG: hypothetical protein ACREQ4_01820 [Candidatus Binataceae bacterium]